MIPKNKTTLVLLKEFIILDYFVNRISSKLAWHLIYRIA